MLLAIVPARGGSKGIPRKNLALLGGKPLIQYTLEAAKASSRIDDVLVSTDDEEIAAFCTQLGFPTQYRRPAELASDEAALMPVIEHALQWYGNQQGWMPEKLLLLQPTSPLRTASDIDSAVDAFDAKQAESLLGVHPMVEHPYECVVADGGDWRYLVQPLEGVARRQDYAGRYYFINGALYLAQTKALLKNQSFVIPGVTLLHEMSRDHGIDVDTPVDMAYAEACLRLSRQLSPD